ncbi:hypothetical protein [Fluviicola sp.]|uniref:hypothetical protein n=1 Tax=Fluviicola sp. TaxID=1917219 RepID=UPI003D2DCF5B
MMVYDLHPDHYPSDNRPVDGNIHYTVINADEVKQFAEGRGDEYILLGTTQEQDVKSMKFLTAVGKAVNEKTVKYRADTFNCTSLATETLEKILYPDEELGQTTLEGPLFSSFTVDAPNQLYNDLMNKSEVKEKSTNKKLDEKAAQEFLDSQIK